MAEFSDALNQPTVPVAEHESFLDTYHAAYLNAHSGEMTVQLSRSQLLMNGNLAVSQAYSDAGSLSEKPLGVPVIEIEGDKPSGRRRSSTLATACLAVCIAVPSLSIAQSMGAINLQETVDGASRNPGLPATILDLREETNRVCGEFEAGTRQNMPQEGVNLEPVEADDPDPWTTYEITGHHDKVILGGGDFRVHIDTRSTVGRLITCSTGDASVLAGNQVAEIGLSGPGSYLGVGDASDVYINGIDSTGRIHPDGRVSHTLVEGSSNKIIVMGALGLAISEADDISSEFVTQEDSSLDEYPAGVINKEASFTS